MLLTRRLQLRDRERIVAIVRRSALAYLGSGIFGTASILLGFFLIVPLVARERVGTVVFALLVLFGVAAFLRACWMWYGNAFVITDDRVIDLDQRGFFRRSVTEARLERIDEVALDVHGIIATLFHLGTVRLQTAGGLVHIELRMVPRPERVQELIGRLQVTRTTGVHAASPSTLIPAIELSSWTDAELLQLRERLDVEQARRRDRAPTV